MNDRDTVSVLRQTHGPTGDGGFRVTQHMACFVDVLSFKSRITQNFIPWYTSGGVGHGFKALRFLVNEILVHCIGFKLDFDQSLEQCSISTNSYREVQVCQFGRFHLTFHVVLRMFEAREARFGQGIDVDDLCPVVLGITQRCQHTRMVGSRVLSNDENCVGVVEILERYGPFADANGLPQTLPAGFMAHVRAIWQVVGAKGAYKGLVQEGRFIARSTRGIEHSSVWVGTGFQC